MLVDRGAGSLEIETPERRFSTGLAWLLGGARVNADITVEVPWGVSVRLETMSGSIEVDALVGEQRYRTISGDISMWRLAGSVDAGSISGNIHLDTESSLRLRANSISGAIRTRAASYFGLLLNTTSGGINVVGGLDAAGDHRIETIAGRVDLAPIGGVSAELRTVSGSIHGPLPHRLEGTRGNWRAVVGDGRPSLRVNSTSGSLRLLDPQQSGAATGTRRAPRPAAPAAPSAPPRPPRPRRPRPPPSAWIRRARDHSQLERRVGRGVGCSRRSRPGRRPGARSAAGPRERRDRGRRGRGSARREPGVTSVSGELEALLRLVAEGRLTAEEAAPIVAALEDKARQDAGGPAATGHDSSGEQQPRDAGRRSGYAQDVLADRRLRVYVAENGRQVINIAIPLATAGFAIDQVPGLSPGHRSRIVEAIQSGITGPIVEVSDGGDEVRIAIE